jgi:hypothetical protein
MGVADLHGQVERVARLAANMRDRPRANPGAERIFMSYRRDDAGHAGRLYDSLSRELERTQIFMDVNAIEPGVNFQRRIDSLCPCVLAALMETAAASAPAG